MRNENLGWFCGNGGEIRMYGLDPTDINEVDKWRADVAVYPNPANDWLSIEIKNVEGDWSYALYDILGKLVMENKINQTKLVLNRNELIDGLYFLKISNGKGGVYTEKVIFNQR
ncbi:MAG: T9SS type A sorting domain-containing protein [Flavobacteriales bacterium]|nr:T9SS type A sorting domain-containing protein [Flavobacteriales bacterium]